MRQAQQPAPAPADSIPQSAIPEAARIRPAVPFDAAAATAAYIATIPADKRARSDAYFEGGYWIQLWSFVITVVMMLLLLGLGWSRRLRDWSERWGRWRWTRTFLYYTAFVVVTTLLAFPFTLYTDFIREHAYGLGTQSFGLWLGDQAKALGVGLILGGLAAAALYAVVRRLPRSWPALGSAVAVLFLVIGDVIAPVFIAPLFNKYTLLLDPRIRDPILRLARTNGIEASKVYVVDASRQTTRVSANVSGILGTERITLNDNLLRRCTLPEIEAVMGHEMGHYVLHHVYMGVVFFTLVIVAGFALLRSGFAWAAARWGERWGIRGIDDPAGLPLVMLIFSIYFFLLTPVFNTFIRSDEAAADIFGLNAVREPDANALVDLKLVEYRKVAPGPLEEFLFYDHPSPRTRIYQAMQWKAEQLAPPAR
ncbi:MAG TPA: M48 family metallopeptidase [Gemmatimonadales bacterium]|nr:M48 family metallopeptidase [Gemmatimonadales bacterium]